MKADVHYRVTEGSGAATGGHAGHMKKKKNGQFQNGSWGGGGKRGKKFFKRKGNKKAERYLHGTQRRLDHRYRHRPTKKREIG